MSQTTIDQTDADNDQAAFDADMEYMRGLVERLTEIPWTETAATRVLDELDARLTTSAPVAFPDAPAPSRWITRRRAAGILAATAVLVGCGVGYAARVYADPTIAVDSHVPNPALGWCPGGGDGGLGTGFCDGKPYPDNTKWHFVRGFIPFKGWTTSMQCVINTGELLQPMAGPGGCGGAA